MFTPEFRRHFVKYVPGDTLMRLRLATKGWKAAADAFIDEGVRRGAIIVHGGNDISIYVTNDRKESLKLVTRVLFLLNVTKVGEYACYAFNLVVVDIPEGIESIGKYAFSDCRSLTTVSFPTTLTLVGVAAFGRCTSLENVDLLHTNLQELGHHAFMNCKELKSMTILDSLQTLGFNIFFSYFKLVPSGINVGYNVNDPTSEVIAYLRSQQSTP